MASALAFRYARALADVVAASSKTPESVSAELGLFENALETSADLAHVLLSPAVAPPRKRAVIADMARIMSLSTIAQRFLFVLVDHRRATLLPEVLQAFQAVIDERQGIVRAEVASAHELTEEQKAELTARLTELTGKQARPQFSLRPELIGGVMARIGSTVYDGSVRGQLAALKEQLTGAGS